VDAEDFRSGLAFTRKFGSGISLYMKALKLLTFTFAAMSLLSTPALVAYIMGGGEGEVVDLSVTTLANVRSTLPYSLTTPTSSANSLARFARPLAHFARPLARTQFPEVDSLGETAVMHWGGLTQREVFIMLSYFDAAAILLCFVAFVFLIFKQGQFESDSDALQTTPSDYTIFVDKLPDDVHAQELTECVPSARAKRAQKISSCVSINGRRQQEQAGRAGGKNGRARQQSSLAPASLARQQYPSLALASLARHNILLLRSLRSRGAPTTSFFCARFARPPVSCLP
jgi:hypothetical protein